MGIRNGYRWGQKPPIGYGLDRSHPDAAGLVAFYLFNEGGGRTVTDLVSGRVGTFSASGVTWSSGPRGAALAFDGSAGSLSAPAPVTSLPLTIATRFKVADGSLNNTLVDVCQHGSTSNHARLLVNSGANLVANYVDSAGTQANAITTRSVANGTWHDACAVFASTGSRTVYLDGVKNGIDTTSLAGLASVDQLDAGVLRWSSDIQFLGGGLEYVAVWNRALSDGQVGAFDPWRLVLAPPQRRFFQLAPAAATPLDAAIAGTAGLVSHWKLDESAGGVAIDAAGGNNAAYAPSGVTLGGAGVSGTCAQFDGAGGSAVGTAVVNLTTASVGAWFYLTANPASSRILFDLRNGFGNSKVNLQLYVNASGVLHGYVSDGADHDMPGVAVPLNQWNQGFLTADGTTARLYLNGSQVASAACGSLAAGFTAPNVYIGGSFTGFFWPGKVDAVSLYNVAVPAASVTSQYNAGRFPAVTGALGAAPPPAAAALAGTALVGAVTGALGASASAPALSAAGTVVGGNAGTLAASPAAPSVALAGQNTPPADPGTLAGAAQAGSVALAGTNTPPPRSGTLGAAGLAPAVAFAGQNTPPGDAGTFGAASAPATPALTAVALAGVGGTLGSAARAGSVALAAQNTPPPGSGSFAAAAGAAAVSAAGQVTPRNTGTLGAAPARPSVAFGGQNTSPASAGTLGAAAGPAAAAFAGPLVPPASFATLGALPGPAAAALAGTTTDPYATTILANPNLADYWRLNETTGTTAFDLKGSKPLAYAGGYALGGPAIVGTGSTATFDGGTGQATRGDAPLAVTAGFAVECWFEAQDLATNRQPVVNFGSSSTGVGLVLNGNAATDGSLFILYDLVAWVDTGFKLRDSGRHHAVLSLDAGGLPTLFVDGAAVYTGPAHAMNTPAGFGVGTDGFGWFRGTVGEVALYSAPMSPATAQAHYVAGLGFGAVVGGFAAAAQPAPASLAGTYTPPAGSAALGAAAAAGSVALAGQNTPPAALASLAASSAPAAAVFGGPATPPAGTGSLGAAAGAASVASTILDTPPGVSGSFGASASSSAVAAAADSALLFTTASFAAAAGPASVALASGPVKALVRRALVAFLKADPGVRSVVGTRVYPLVVPGSGALPALTYQLAGLRRETGLSGPTGVADARFLIAIVSRDPADGEAGGEAVRQLLDGLANATFGVPSDPGNSVLALGVTLNAERDLADDPGDGAGAPVYRTLLDYTIRYREPQPRAAN